MTIANPLTKPNITGCGTNRINLPNLKNPAIICIKPASTTVAKMYSTPLDFANATITIAMAPVAPYIIPGLPPKIEVIKPIENAAYSPVRG